MKKSGRGIETCTSTGSVRPATTEQGDDSEVGVLVTADEVVTLSWQPSAAFILEWVPITGWWRDSPSRAQIEHTVPLQSNT
jgi:hypothetical protein